MLILLVVCIQQKRAPRLFEVFSIVLALGGVFMLTTHGSLTNMAVSPAALVVGIISAFCVVIYTIWPKNLQKQYPTPMLQGWAFLMGGTFFALVFRPWRMNYVPNAAGIAGIAAVVLIGNVLAFSCYMSGVKYIGPQKSSLFSFAEPVTAAIISTLVLGSPLYRVGRHRLCLHLFDAGAAVHQQRKAGQKHCKRMITGQVSTKAAETV